MSKMKNNAIVGNIGHFDNEIDMAGLYAWQGEHLQQTAQPHDPGCPACASAVRLADLRAGDVIVEAVLTFVVPVLSL